MEIKKASCRKVALRGLYGLTVMLIVLYSICCSSVERRLQPLNKVVIMIDGSGSYVTRQGEAVNRTIRLLTEISETKLHRWESGSDQITIISLDAMPQTVWAGTLKELKSINPATWTTTFRARSDYAGCTDIGAAFRLATRYLEGDSFYVKKYLIGFSDLINQPPTNSIRDCRIPAGLPPYDFPWESLKDVSISIFWVPPEQKFVWQKAINQHGLEPNFRLYSSSESGATVITPPTKAKIEVTDEMRRAQRKQVTRYASLFFKGFGIVVLILILMPLAIYLVGKHNTIDG